jgi:hypothetical protein
LEVLAYLITAARTQMDEAAEYGPLRLLTAANMLADRLVPSPSQPVAELRRALSRLPPTAVPRQQRETYTALLDDLCVQLADCLLAREASS